MRITSSSDEMIDIQIEESLVRETLMVIDSSNFETHLASRIVFILLLVIVIFIGSRGPPPILTDASPSLPIFHSVSESTASFPYLISNLSKLNRFLQISLLFFRENTSFQSNSTFTVQCFITFLDYQSSEIRKLEFGRMTFRAALTNGAISTPEFSIFSDLLITYASVNLTVDFFSISNDFTSAMIFVRFGDVNHTLFQITFRVFFSIVILLAGVFLLRRLGAHPKFWNLEQKITIPLLVSSFFFTNPFFAFEYLTLSFLVFDVIVRAFFVAYLRLFLLILFDGLRFKNRNTQKCFFFPKIAFAIFAFLVDIVHASRDALTGTREFVTSRRLCVLHHMADDNGRRGRL
jgi:hypothetical protein